MADVSVRQQDSVGQPAERLHLVGEVGCRVDQESLAGGRVEQPERGDAHAPGRIGPRLDADRLVAARVGDAPVLRDAQNDGLGTLRGRAVCKRSAVRSEARMAATVD